MNGSTAEFLNDDCDLTTARRPMDNDARVDGLIDRWEDLRQQGASATIEQLCAHCPELAEEVRRRIEALQAMDLALVTKATDLRSTPKDRDPYRAVTEAELPGELRASALFRPERHHAQGGLGEILTAHQEELDRLVALKRIRPDKLHEPARQRFLREAAITARLQHPGIVPVYSLGHDDDGPFYTMPFIRGQTLQEAIDAFHGDDSLRHDSGQRSLKLRGMLQQFIAVCNTVAYAHDQAVVHRDLKPSNIMLGPYGETLVMDWGLAKRLAANDSTGEAEADVPSPSPSPSDLTASGAVMGTPQYMSPEQAKGELIGPASDVFNLGLILYAILTGKSGFDVTSFQGADPLRAVREAAIIPPREQDRSVPRALEAICIKALAARPDGRYGSARDLADEVTRWLADQPVSAWREPFAVRARRWMRRNRTAVTGAATALVVGVLGLSAVAVVQSRANSALELKNRQLTTANVATTQAKNEADAALAETIRAKQADGGGAGAEGGRSRSRRSRGEQRAEAVTTFLVEAFRSPDPSSQDGRQVKVADLLERATERLDKEFAGSPATRGSLLDTLGWTYLGLGLYDQAVGLLTKARAVREAALGSDDPATLKSRHNLAVAYYYAGRPAEAIALHEATLKLDEAQAGPRPSQYPQEPQQPG